MKVIILLSVLALSAGGQEQSLPIPVKPPVTLEGSPEARLYQNWRADREHLVRVQNSRELAKLQREKVLVRVPRGGYLRCGKFRAQNAWVLPQTAAFLSDMSAAFGTEFRRPLTLTSAVRTATHQRWLRQRVWRGRGKRRRLVPRNSNAVEADGSLASLHLTGAAVDIAKRSLTAAQLKWARAYLLRLEELGCLDATEETKQKVFHIVVFGCYANTTSPEGAR